MRKIFALLAVVVAVAACDSRVGGTFVAPTNNISGTFILRTFNGKTPPTVYDSSATLITMLVGDTLTFNGDGSLRDATAMTTTIPPGAPVPSGNVMIGAYTLSGTALAITLPSGSGNTFATFPSTYINGRVTLTDAAGVWVYSR
jgi:hypothetical protein